MSSGRLGMNPVAMTALADDLAHTALALGAVIADVDVRVRSGVLAWFGAIAEDFCSTWDTGIKLELAVIELELGRLVSQARSEISAQIAASAGDEIYAELGLRSPIDTSTLTGGQSEAYANGRLHVTEQSSYPSTGPSDVHDLIGLLNTPGKGHPPQAYSYPGGISVTITGTPPNRHVVVAVSGTEEWLPGSTNPDDITTNVQDVLGANSDKGQAIEEALIASGVTPEDHIMLVGHSQGGADAMLFAHDHGDDPHFHIDSVLTVGAPHVPRYPPSTVEVLQLRGTDDVVPDLGDFWGNTPSNVTVQAVHDPLMSPITAHDPSIYQRQINATDYPSIDRFQRDQSGFFSGGSAQTYVYSNDRATGIAPDTLNSIAKDSFDLGLDAVVPPIVPVLPIANDLIHDVPHVPLLDDL